MSARSFSVKFRLDESDVAYFKRLFREARKNAKGTDARTILDAANALVVNVRENKKAPRFVLDAVEAIEDLTQIIVDEDYQAPKSIRNQVLAALAYFSNPDDLIPDEIPVLGFLDDAIMIKFVEEEFKHELWAYRQFKKFRAGAEVREWTPIAKSRMPGRLEKKRRQLRAAVNTRRAKDEAKGRGVGF